MDKADQRSDRERGGVTLRALIINVSNWETLLIL